MRCLGVPPTRDQQNSPPPFQRLQSVKKMSCFIFVCLRSVHSLLSLRFGGRSSYLTHVHPSLHCAQFISPTSAPHSIIGFLIPQPKSTHIPFRFADAFILPCLYLAFHAGYKQSTQKSIQQSFISYPPIVPFQSVATHAFFQRISNGLFSSTAAG